MRQLMWFRSDLRIQDNTALSQAMRSGPTIALYLLTPGQWLRHDDAACKVDFWLRNLRELGKALATLNVPLLVRQCHDWSDAPLQIADICREHNIFSVHANEEYGINESLRDRQVGAYLCQQDINWHSHLDQILFKPGSVLTRAGGYFQVYSQFRKVCHERLHSALPNQVAPPARLPATAGAGCRWAWRNP
jgi:deoxyribodipyrimidine photo-lyase